jgi:dTDP-4-amino-4,6-dideoxygalactose transaminase
VKLPHINRWNNARRQAAQTYNELLAGVPGIATPEITVGHVFHQYTLKITKADRNQVQKKLQEQGIGTMVYYPIPQDQLPIYKGEYSANPVSQEIATQVLSLPIWSGMSNNILYRVVKELAKAI